MRRANRLCGGYLPIQEDPEVIPDEGEIDQELDEAEEDSIKIRGGNCQ